MRERDAAFVSPILATRAACGATHTSQFDANRYVRREATADFGATLTERATGCEVWRDRRRAYNVDGGFLTLNVGITASPEDLRRVALRTMSEAVDALLDKPGFHAALPRG